MKQSVIKNTLLTAACSMITLLTSCDSFLNIQPKGELIPETAADYEALLNFPELCKTAESYTCYLTDDVFLPDEAENDFTPGLNNMERHQLNLYRFDKQVFSEAENDNLWLSAYQRIFNYDVVIDNIMDATRATDAEKRLIRAEALTGRALEFLNLVNAYAKHYDAATADADPGVPLVLKADIGQKDLTRASVKQVYELILNDLNAAENDLPTKPRLNMFRASKAAAWGLLARTHLYMGNYAEALKNAEKVINENNFLLDLKEYQVVDPLTSIGRLNVPDKSENKENVYARLAPYVYGASEKAFGSDELMSLYTSDDMRLQLYFSNMVYGVSLSRQLYIPYVEMSLGITTPEMYLIAAECEARTGNTAKALQLLDQLRDNRIKNNTPLTAANSDEALKLVLEERRREFAMQGLVRLIDLKRLNKETRFAKNVTHVVDGQTLTLTPNDPRYVLPIPARPLRFNPGMVYNPR